MGPTRDLMLFMASKFRTVFNHATRSEARLRLLEDGLARQKTSLRNMETA